MDKIQDSFINLRNELKTWITNNLKLKANKSDLTASNGIIFQFGVDNEENYGFIVNNEFVPFGGSAGIDIAEIEVFTATSNVSNNGGSITKTATLTLNKGKYILCANGEGATGNSVYTSNYYLNLNVGGADVGAELFKYMDNNSNGGSSIRAVSKYYICEIDEDDTEVTATFYSNTFYQSASNNYSIVGSVGLLAFKLSDNVDII